MNARLEIIGVMNQVTIAWFFLGFPLGWKFGIRHSHVLLELRLEVQIDVWIILDNLYT